MTPQTTPRLLLLFLVALPLMAADKPTPTPSPQLFTSVSTVNNSFLTMEETWDASLVIFGNGESAPLLIVQGMAERPLHRSTRPLNADVLNWRAPAKPEDVVITLTTKDGKKWRAWWEEVKP
jgi:hypothetical protein